MVFRQSSAKLVRVLPLAGLMAAVSAGLFLLGFRGAGLVALVGGGIGLAFFGPALLILLWALVRPNYVMIDSERLRFRLHSLEGSLAWNEIREISTGVGWPSVTFHDCERASRSFRFSGLRPLGWLLAIPTRAASLVIGRPIAHLYPSTRGQLVSGFHANERMFGFHYGLPTSTLEGSTRDIVAAMLRAAKKARRGEG